MIFRDCHVTSRQPCSGFCRTGPAPCAALHARVLHPQGQPSLPLASFPLPRPRPRRSPPSSGRTSCGASPSPSSRTASRWRMCAWPLTRRSRSSTTGSAAEQVCCHVSTSPGSRCRGWPGCAWPERGLAASPPPHEHACCWLAVGWRAAGDELASVAPILSKFFTTSS